MAELILLPGTLCDERLFTHQVDHLADVAEVAIGKLTSADTINGMAQSVLQEAPDTFSLAGLSLGGIVALEIMRIAPHRVSRLALLDTTFVAPTAAQRQRWAIFDHLAASGSFTSITRDHLLPDLIWGTDETVIELVLDMAASIGPEAFRRQNAALATRGDFRSILPGIAVPTLVLCGEHERVCTVDVHRAMADAIPGAVLVIVERAGHLSPLDNPTAVTDALRRWLLTPAGEEPVPIAS